MTQDPKDPPVNLDHAREALRLEGQAILQLADAVGGDFAAAAAAIYRCQSKVVMTGLGKAGIIAQKISATFASTGTVSIFLHPVEALHGDLGRVGRGDVVIALSHSGTTDEILRLVDLIKGLGGMLIAVSGNRESPLCRYADLAVCYGNVQEACPLGLAPTVSTTCMLALGDALAVTVMQMRDFSPEEFATYHPAGALGRKLLRVEEAMIKRHDDRLTAVKDSLPLGEALAAAEHGRRVGAMLLVDADGRLSGILTDADLRRLMLKHPNGDLLARPTCEVMIRNPKHIHLGELASEAQAIMNRYRIDELPVLDADARPVGIIDVQDLMGIRTAAGEAT